MEIKFPSHYEIEYDEKTKKYNIEPYKGEFKRKLLLASRGYCMYCGRRIIIDGADISHIEHSVDKRGNYNQRNEDFLEHCKYNLSVSCPKCNLVYKKKIEKIDLSEFKKKTCPDICENECDEYLKLKKNYQERNQMYLAPRGYAKEGKYVSIAYDLLKTRFVPASDIRDDDELNFFANNQIERFALNEEMYTYCIIEICEMIIRLFDMGIRSVEDVLHILVNFHYDNVVGEKFLEYIFSILEKNPELQVEDLRKMCEMIILLDALAI